MLVVAAVLLCYLLLAEYLVCAASTSYLRISMGSVAIHGRREHGPAEFGEGTTLTATAAAIGEEFGVPSVSCLPVRRCRLYHGADAHVVVYSCACWRTWATRTR